MNKIKIVTDSCVTFEPGVTQKYGIEVVSLSVMIDDVIYKDTDLDRKDFMSMMASAQALPKTSQPPIGEFLEVYDRLADEGYDVVSLHVTGLLSGTVDAARQAAQISKGNVTVIDTKFIDQALAFICIKAAEVAANDNTTVDDVTQAVHQAMANSLLYIGVSDLTNLVKGGRLSRATGVLSNILNIKVVMQLLSTGLETMTKGRGTKAFKKWFSDVKASQLDNLDNVKKIGISHANGIEIATYFKEELSQLFPNAVISVLDTASVIATHTGPGAFAVMFYSE